MVYKTMEVQVDLSEFATEDLLQELVDRRCPEEGPSRQWLLEMLSPELEPLLVDLYEGLRGTVVYDDIEKMLAKLFDITLGRLL
jgi:hypothetical protein